MSGAELRRYALATELHREFVRDETRELPSRSESGVRLDTWLRIADRAIRFGEKERADAAKGRRATSGAEHYVKAEDLLDLADGLAEDDPGLPVILAEAQARSTLALAAAQALSPITVSMGDTDRITEWARATAPSLNTTEGK